MTDMGETDARGMETLRAGVPGAPQDPSERVGRVLGIEPATSSEFRVVLDPDNYLQLDDLVVVGTSVPKLGDVQVFGLVVEVAARFEGARFESDMALIAEEGSLPAELARSATVQTIRIVPEVWVAPDPGEPVFRVGGAARDQALYADEMGRRLAVGFARDGRPLWVDLDFFDGRKGGHISISGVSGVATKTSFALAFLRCLTAHPETLGTGAANLRVLVFNVKQEDLLWLDKPNKDLSDDARAAWAALGVPAEPFPSVSLWAPPRPVETLVPDTESRAEGISAFSWTPREFVERELLRFLFTETTDFRNQLTFVEERVRSQLKRLVEPVPGEP
ncbi:MAG TPA: ATP-binding protein, partial [Actinomycetota bacterium]